jgi:hypothetical protein
MTRTLRVLFVPALVALAACSEPLRPEPHADVATGYADAGSARDAGIAGPRRRMLPISTLSEPFGLAGPKLEQQYALIRDQATWAAFSARYGLRRKVDFSRRMVLVVATGPRDIAGPWIRVDSIRAGGGQVTAYVTRDERQAGAFVTIYPHHIVQVPRAPGPVVWAETVLNQP